MTRQDLYADFRRKIGGKLRTEVIDSDADSYLDSATEWLAAQLKWRVGTDTQSLALVADQQELQLPDDLIEVIFIEWNSKRLTPGSVYGWDRVGTDWRGATSAALSEFAIQGRKLVLNPPPDDDAIEDDPTLTLRGVFMPEKVSVAGPVDVAPLDARLIAWKAAQQWLKVNTSQENYARAQAYQSEIDPLLKSARKNAQKMIRDYQPRFRWRSYRNGAAR